MDAVHKWGKRHAKILDNYLMELTDNKIPYFILRNYEGLPEINKSKDVDLIIKPGEYKKAAKLMIKVLADNDVPNYYVMKFEKANCWIGIDLAEDFYIHIDLIEGYLNKGFEIFTFQKLYDNTTIYKKYRILNKPYDLVMLLTYKIIGCKELKQRYREKINKFYTEYKQEVDCIINETFDKDLAAEICKHLRKRDYDWIIDNADRLSISSKKLAFKNAPFYTLVNILLFLFEKFKRIVIYPKKFRRIIAVEAPDGTGKTTFINLLITRLAECLVTDSSRAHVYHFRPGILPNLGELGEKTGVMKQDKDFTNPHRGKKTNVVSSLVRIIYYIFDYVFGGAIYLRKDARFDKFSIFDRYVYDILVDPVRSRIYLPYIVRKFFCNIATKPQITFVLDAEIETIYKRKQELTKEEIARQLIEFKKLEHVAKGYYRLDANNTPDEIVNEAISIIVKKFANKTVVKD